MSNQNSIFGIKLTNIDISSLIKQIMVWISQGNTLRIINNLNVHAILIAKKNHEFAKALNKSDIVFCDGFGIKVASKILGTDVGTRMTPPDWIDDLFKVAEKNSFRLYFLGDENEVIQKFVEQVKTNYPNLVVTGFHDGFFHHDIKLCNQIVKEISVKEEDEVDKDEENDQKILPEVKINEKLENPKFNTEQHFTEPPPRFS